MTNAVFTFVRLFRDDLSQSRGAVGGVEILSDPAGQQPIRQLVNVPGASIRCGV